MNSEANSALNRLPARHTSGTPRANFDPVARVYRWAEFLLLGPLLTRTRLYFLQHACRAHRALVLGDGDGRFLATLLQQAPSMKALAVDTSGAMLRLLRGRCAFAGTRLATLQTSVLDLPSTAELRHVDLIVSHFLLDCLPQDEVDTLAGDLATQVAPGCLWVISEFGLPAKQPWRLLSSIYVRLLYLAFRALTRLPVQKLPDLASALTHAGFQRLARHERLKGLLYSELWRLSA